MRYKIYDKERLEYIKNAVVNQEGEILICIGDNEYLPAEEGRYTVVECAKYKNYEKR